MKKKHSFFVSSCLAVIVLCMGSCSKDDKTQNTSKSIADVVATTPGFSILYAAVVKANLVQALSSGSITVFAPDNDAFSASGISESTINALPVATIDSILKYHVIGAAVRSTDVPVSDTVKSLLGLNIYASNNANGVFVNGVKVKTADVVASNGVIHVISKVLMPPTQTIAQIAASNTDFSLLVTAVQKAGLLGAITSPGKYTVFAPSNAAFNAAGFKSAADINNASVDLISTVVKYHVIPTNIFAGDLITGASPATLQGGTLQINAAVPPTVKISGSAKEEAKITAADIIATNGVVHVIDNVLLP